MAQVSKAKRALFTVFFILIVFALLFLVELALRIAGYGVDTRVFVKPKYLPQFYVENPDYINKYFEDRLHKVKTTLSESYIRNIFESQKQQRALRGFLIGGSTAQGFPYDSNHSFSKIAALALNQAGKYQYVQIVCLGSSAMSSYYEKDIARKILEYAPDFVAVYSAHNEYYGTISATTGGNYATKSAYLALKELRLFQLLFDVIRGMGRAPENRDSPDTLMARRFGNTRLPANDLRDREVAGDFIRNTESIVRMCERKKIPVFIMEPVCNLYDMPPFSGAGDDACFDLITNYYATVRGGDKKAVKDLYEWRMKHPEYDSNANVLYCDALALKEMGGRGVFEGLMRAKDMDNAPFRARSVLIDSLRDFAASGKHANIRYVPLLGRLTNDYGEEVMGNRIFIDHLHFNWKGQLLVARYLAESVADAFGFSEQEKGRVSAYFADEKKIRDELKFMPVYEVNAYLTVSNLVCQEPFRSMKIPYRMDPIGKALAGNPLLNDANILEAIYADPSPDKIKTVVNYMLQTANYAGYYSYIQSMLAVNPGDYHAYYSLAKFYASLKSGNAPALDYYVTAYLFSEKKKEIYESLTNYLGVSGQGGKVGWFNQTYGFPERE